MLRPRKALSPNGNPTPASKYSTVKTSKENLLRRSALFFAMMASGGNPIVYREIWLALIFVSCFQLIRWRLPTRSEYRLLYVWLILTMLLLAILQGADSYMSVASRFAWFMAPILLLEVYLSRSLGLLMDDLFIILRLMAVQAIITFILGTTLSSVFWTVDVQGVQYYTLGFLFNFHYIDEKIAGYVRPDGFFWEPGVFQIYLSIFLYLFWRMSVFWVVISCIAIVTVWSTTGLIIAIVLIVMALPRLATYMPRSVLVIGMVIVLSTVPIIGFLALQNYNEKMNGKLRGSYLSREYDFYTGLNIIETRPLTGIGFGVDTYLSYARALSYSGSELRRKLTEDRLNTNGVIQVLYTIGIPLGLPLLAGIFTQRLFDRRFAMGIILLPSLNGEPLAFSVFFLFILYSGFLLKPKQLFPSARQLRWA